MTKPRILILENSVHVTGALKSVTRTAYDLVQYFDFVFVLPANSKGRFWIESKGFDNIHELEMTELSKRVFPLLTYAPKLFLNTFRLRRIVREQRIDLIHVNDLYNLLPAAIKILGSDTPYISHVRFLPEKFPPILFNLWLKLHLKYADYVVAVSNYLRQQLPDHDKIRVIHNELPVEERYPPDLDKADMPTLLYLSNIIPGKGHQFALEAFSRIHHQYPHWRLRLVGGDMGTKKNAEYLTGLKWMARKLNIESKLEWVPFVKDVEREYKQASIVLNFSESESFSITCLEALYFGCPLIATDCGGPAEIIDHNETGLVVANKDVNAMTNAMVILMSNSVLRQRFGAEARVRVRDKFSIENTSLQLRKIYDNVLRRRNPTNRS